jgi:hypothetical protein
MLALLINETEMLIWTAVSNMTHGVEFTPDAGGGLRDPELVRADGSSRVLLGLRQPARVFP